MTDQTQAARQAEEQRWALMLAGDREGLGNLFSDALLYAHSDSSIDSKSSYLKALEDGSLIYDALDCQVSDTACEGETTVFFGVMKADVRRNGNALKLNSSYVTVWVSTPQGQKLIAHKSTPLK